MAHWSQANAGIYTEDNPNLTLPGGWAAGVRKDFSLPAPAPPPSVPGEMWSYQHDKTYCTFIIQLKQERRGKKKGLRRPPCCSEMRSSNKPSSSGGRKSLSSLDKPKLA
eukprot:1158365-Pelagomonas_calceolata.AAC.10